MSGQREREPPNLPVLDGENEAVECSFIACIVIGFTASVLHIPLFRHDAP